MLELESESGLIYGCTADGAGGLRRLASAEIDATLAAAPAFAWLHLNLADRRVQAWIAATPVLPDSVRGFLLDRDARVRLEPLAGGLAGVFSDFLVSGDEQVDETGTVRFYCAERLIVSVRAKPLVSLDRLRRAVEAGVPVSSSADVMVTLLHQFEATFATLLAELGLDLDRMEDAILLNRFREHGGDLGRLRRQIVLLRRHVNPQRHVLHAALGRLPAWAGETLGPAIRGIADGLTAHAAELDHLQESARLIQDELSSRLAETTNRNLYLLSIVTALFMPMTLITGIFGMNVAGLPGVEDSSAFAWVMAGMAATGLAALALLRMKRVI